MSTIATITENTRYIKPYAIRILKPNEQYPIDSCTRYATIEEAQSAIERDAPGALLVTEYRFQKEVTAF